MFRRVTFLFVPQPHRQPLPVKFTVPPPTLTDPLSLTQLQEMVTVKVPVVVVPL